MKRFGQIAICALALAAGCYGADQPDRKIVHREEPEYPAIAAKNNIHGSVKLKIWITADGSIRRLEYIGGHPLLAESALKAVKNWKYQPGGSESTSQVEIKF
ncbi:MAG TPA: energy transducer TonB [Terriglobales bacterium]|nr:energy transducer TonB [Terriglobales bacterium]